MALEDLGALWKGKPGSKAVLTGKLKDGRKILVFKNERKNSDKQPDYRVMVDDGAIPEKKVDDGDTPF